MKKANVMKRAWELYKAAGCTTRYEFGIALRTAWQEVNSIAAWTQKDRYMNAFYTKYPNGSFTSVTGSKNYRFNVTFAPGGKAYTYIGGIVMIGQKLGLDVA